MDDKILINKATIGRAIADFDAIQDAIIDKGVSVPSGTPTSQYGDKIRQISGGAGGGWTRPADRPAKPDMADNTILMLFGVSENSPNDMAFAVTTSSTTGYTVDWGDGEITTHGSNTKAEHIYDFAAIDRPVDSRGYKMVWITVGPTNPNTNITVFNTQQRPSLRSTVAAAIFVPQLFELYIQCPALTTLTFPTSTNAATTVHYKQLEIFGLDENSITTSSYLMSYCCNLQKIEKLRMDKMTACTYFMYNCYSYNQPFPEGVTFNSVTSYFMYGCSSYNQPFPEDATFNSATNNFMQGCSSYNQPFPERVTFNSITMSFMYGCPSYNQPFPEDVMFSKSTTGFMNNCNSYSHSLTVDLEKQTTPMGATSFANCYALKSLHLLNMSTVQNAFNISNSSLDVPALVALFGDLADRTGLSTGTITITNCYGAARLSAADRLVATEKNWTISG